MASPKVFISSTCYDLNVVRSQLRQFILSLGYEPVMSDYMDILYDPRIHTHTSCLKEIPNCDMVILIVGSRFGGKGVPESISQLDYDKLRKLSKSASALENPENLSITQLEILGAISENVPIFPFVDSRVMHDHELYEKNKTSLIIDQIKFPSIEKAETAKFIFEFINFLRHRVKGNSVYSFSRYEDIEETLKRQWSSMYQRLLWEQRKSLAETRQIENMADQLESLKTAILAAIPTTDARETARAVVRFRRMVEMLQSFDGATAELLKQDITFDDLLDNLNIKFVAHLEIRGRVRLVYVRKDDRFYEPRMGQAGHPERLMSDWDNFRQLKPDTKSIVIETASDMGGYKHFILNDETYSNAPDRTNDQREEAPVGLVELIAANLDK